jgi:hypothetical protein
MATASKSTTQQKDTVERLRSEAGSDPASYLPAAAAERSPQFQREVRQSETSERRALLRVDNL